MNKKVLAVAVSSALAAPMAAHAVKYKLSGQINRAAVYANDGERADIQFIDNQSSGTRWRLTGSEDIGSGNKVGFNWEWQNSSNASGAAIGSADFGDTQTMRKAEVWFSGGWGKVSLGQGDGAGNGTTEVDLSDTWNVAYTGRSSFGDAVAWRFSGAGLPPGGTTTAGLTHGATFSHFDAYSRYDRVRDDSPALGPVTIAISAGQADRYEGAVRWSQGIGGGQISAGAFYGSFNGQSAVAGIPDSALPTATGNIGNTRWGGSIAYLFSFGLNLQVAYAENESNQNNATKGKNWYAKIGYKFGNNAVSIGYGESKDANQGLINNSNALLGAAGDGSGWNDKGFNIGFNHNIPKAKVDLYAGLAGNSLDIPTGFRSAGVSVDDIYTITVGTKLKFD
jgi:predicted porin